MRLYWIALAVLVIDQATKVAVRLNMSLHQSDNILGGWLRFTFTENDGMAFGIVIGSTQIVTALAIIATILISVYLWRVRTGYGPYTSCLALILGGAIGNIVDRLFYGLIFGYETFLAGRVVDFIHLDLWSGLVSESIPLIGGQYLAVLPIFNVADIAICGGVAGILIFHKRFHLAMLEASTSLMEPESAALGASVDNSS